MTDKELKKLSRLELLELLLAESRENERLRAELEQIKQENTIKKNVQKLNEISENLDETSEKLSEALQQLSVMVSNFNKINKTMGEDKTEYFADKAKVANQVDTADGAII